MTIVGAGGMGEVYRARDSRLDRIVAVKVLRAAMADRPDPRQRLQREARAISKLSHPNICMLYDIGEQDGIDFLVMEYVEGETLEGRLTKGPLPPEQALQYGIQLANALDEAHRHGITHRDLKPGNIMLTKSGSKLLDFGLAKLKTQESPLSDGALLAQLFDLTKLRLTGEAFVLQEKVDYRADDGRTLASVSLNGTWRMRLRRTVRAS
ncbi:MAG: serine/threonine-protein kinase [Candidatus Sulfotelmatobacter sp.]